MSLLYLSLTSAISSSSVNFPLNHSPDGCPKIVRPTAKPLTKGALVDASNTALNLSSGASKPKIKIPRQYGSFA